jgi:hypothetical protein
MKTALVSVAMVLLAFSCTYGGTAKAPDGIEFTYTDPAAASVSLAGSFNNWDSNANPMTKGDDGVWRVVLPLAPDTYEYKFVINGSDWVADPENPKIVGDYGNSEITVNEEGDPVTTGVAVAITNTPVNSRVLITGWLRGLYGLRRNVLGDTRYRGTRPSHSSYISFNPTIGSDVKGSATLKLDTGDGDIREITADLFSGWLRYKGPGFSVTGYHNEEILVFDDPLRAVGDIVLPGSVERDMIEYGRGTQGFVGEFEFGRFEATAFIADTQDGSIFNSPHRFKCDSWGAGCDTVLRYDNIGTDNMGVRAKYEVMGTRLGFSFLTERNGWWVGFDEQEESEALTRYRQETGDTLSNWFEMGTDSRFIGGDLLYDAGDFSVYGEYAWTSYDAGWDAGNRVRKQGDVFVDGKIDVPVGDTKGNSYKVGGEYAMGEHTFGLAYEGRKVDGMDEDEVYVTHHALPYEDPDTPLMDYYGPSLAGYTFYDNVYTNVMNIEPFNIYEHHELPEFEGGVAEVRYSGSALGLDLGLELDFGRADYKYKDALLDDAELKPMRILPWIAGDLWKERFTYKVLYEATRDNLHQRMPSEFDRDEIIVKGDFLIGRSWSIYYNVRWAGYDWTEDDAGKSQTFWNPHFAFVWSPFEMVELRFGYGINPIYYRDTPVEGWEIGRDRWLTSRTWMDPTTTLVGAEEEMDNTRVLTLMGVIAF